MRLKGTLRDPGALMAVVSAVERIGVMVHVCVSPESVAIVQQGEAAGGEHVYAELKADAVFSTLRVESKSDNHIAMQLSARDLVRALRPGAKETEPVVLKLRKISGRPFVTVEVRGRGVEVVQDVPVAIVPYDTYREQCAEPELDEPTIKLRMPDMKLLHSVVERMRTLSDEAAVGLAADGTFEISVKTDEAAVCTTFRDLVLDTPAGRQAAEEAGEDAEMTVSRMDVRRLARVLHCRALSYNHVVCAVVPGCAFIVFAMLRGPSLSGTTNGGSVAYYIPLLADE